MIHRPRLRELKSPDAIFYYEHMCPGWCRTEMDGPDAPLSAGEGADTLVWLALDAPRSLRGAFVKQRKVIPW